MMIGEGGGEAKSAMWKRWNSYRRDDDVENGGNMGRRRRKRRQESVGSEFSR